MANPQPFPARRLAVLLAGIVAVLFVVGCGPSEQISRYQVPHEKLAAKPVLTKPADWKELPGDEMTYKIYEAGSGEQVAKVTVTPLSGPAGGTLMNVNRWREQLLLPPINQTQLELELKNRGDSGNLDVQGLTAKYVDFVGHRIIMSEGKPVGVKDDRILGVYLHREGQTWFFKMRGAPEVVAKQRPAFEDFVRAARFDGGNHE